MVKIISLVKAKKSYAPWRPCVDVMSNNEKQMAKYQHTGILAGEHFLPVPFIVTEETDEHVAIYWSAGINTCYDGHDIF